MISNEQHDVPSRFSHIHLSVRPPSVYTPVVCLIRHAHWMIETLYIIYKLMHIRMLQIHRPYIQAYVF